MTKTWKQRIAESHQRMPQDLAMQEEIDELRANLAEQPEGCTPLYRAAP